MTLCLVAGALAVPLMTAEATLAWTHSVERTAWEEDWRAEPAGVRLVAARVKGSGAGVDPPPDAVLEDGFWRWSPDLPPLREVVLRRSGATADWRVCRDGGCTPLAALLPPDADPVVLTVCAAETGPNTGSH